MGVRGAGYCFDGLYYVKSVTHHIKRGEYKQNFTLTRNGLVSTVSDGEPMTIAKSPASNSTPKRYYGKYRGLVVNNIDPMQIGRIMAQVPDVLGEIPSSWALPCVPAAGIQAGCFMSRRSARRCGSSSSRAIPDYPIWTGGFWGVVAEVPVLATVPPAIPPGQNIVLQTTGQNTVVLSDTVPAPFVGGIMLKSSGGTDARRQRHRNLS